MATSCRMGTGEFIATHNGKTIKIPLSTRKEKYSHNVTASDNVFNTEKWHAPKDFKLPESVLTTLDEQIPEEQKKN